MKVVYVPTDQGLYWGIIVHDEPIDFPPLSPEERIEAVARYIQATYAPKNDEAQDEP